MGKLIMSTKAVSLSLMPANSMVNDYFSQAAIDFFLGNVTSMIFDEFESTMMTKDPGVSMQKMREQAIETSQKIVIEDDREDFIGGWTLLSPLLTDAALYLCRFDWRLDKVSSFERVDLSHILGIKVGTYITSTISAAQADESKNVGLVITYEPGKHDVVRTNTRSLSSISGPSSGHQQSGAQADLLDSSIPAPAVASGILNQGILGALSGKQRPLPPRKIALKALYSHTAISDARGVNRVTELEHVKLVASEIERMVFSNQPVFKIKEDRKESEDGPDEGRKSIIEEGDIISLAEAKRSTGYFEHLGHSIKKLVWA
jgi:hypothetical protein